MGMVEGKVAIVTGAGRGVGRALAMGLAAEGAKVVVNDIGASLQGAIEGGERAPADDVVDEIKAAGGEAVANKLSVADPRNGETMVKQALDAFGRLDIVVNNAGILRDTIFHKMSLADFQDVINVHLIGAFSLSRAAAGIFREQESGAFVHITSTSGLVGNLGQVNYMAAKMAIVGLSRGIALDMQRYNVRSNCFAPFAWSRMTSSVPHETPAEKRRYERFQRMTPETVAPLCTFLASDAAAGITGNIFSVRLNEIYVLNQPRPIRSIHTADGWTPASLAEAFAALKPSLTPLEVSGDVFSWDPI